MKVVNINYRGFIIDSKEYINFQELQTKQPPQMITYKCANGTTLLIFSSGKCRLMGCKTAIKSTQNMFPFPIRLTHIQSVTASLDLGYSINLLNLAKYLGVKKCVFEPEIFPALRLVDGFKPLCVNVFASGKVIVLGLKTIDITKTCMKIKIYLDNSNNHLKLYKEMNKMQ